MRKSSLNIPCLIHFQTGACNSERNMLLLRTMQTLHRVQTIPGVNYMNITLKCIFNSLA